MIEQFRTVNEHVNDSIETFEIIKKLESLGINSK